VTWGVADLTVAYGHTTALQGVTVATPPGRVTALVGGDGAGKTTLLRALAGVPIRYRGVVRRPAPERITYVPTGTGAISDLTVAENLDFVARAYRLGDVHDRADALLARTGLGAFPDRLAGRLSGGMRQKLAVVMGMLPDPEMLVLDEPTTGVDPVSRSEVWRLIAAAASGGAAVVVASTYLDEAERANEVAVLHQGILLASGTPSEVIAAMPGAILDLASPQDRSRAWPRGGRWRQWQPDGHADGVEPDLEDAVIVASLAAEEVAP